jgi:hypothetical protein
MHVMGQCQAGDRGVTKIGDTRENGIKPMGGEIGTDCVRMSHIQQARCHSLQLEMVDEVGRSLQGHVAEMDLVPTGLIEETGNEGTDFSRPEY